MPHGFRERLVVTVFPGGFIEVREARRHEVIRLDLGILFAKEMIRRALAEQRKARGARSSKARRVRAGNGTAVVGSRAGQTRRAASGPAAAMRAGDPA
jgi:hypothetical protein